MAVLRERHNNNGIRVLLAVLIISLAWISCQRDEIDYNRVAIYPVVSSLTETAVVTRALPAGYSAYSYDGQGQPLSLAAYAIAFDKTTGARANQYDALNKSFTALADGNWRSTLELEVGSKYNLYTHTAFPGASDYQLNYTQSNTTVTFSGLNVITDSDPLVERATAGKRIKDTDPASAITAEYPTMDIGTFSIGEVLPTTDNDGIYRAFIALEHLYAKASIVLYLDDTYNELRTIRIKSAVIETTAGGTLAGTHEYSFTNNKVTLATTNTSGNPISIDLIDEDVTLTTTPTEYGWFCFIPSLKPNCKLSVTYDVLDKAGNLLGERTVSNNKILDRVANPARGSDYEIKIKVSPTYLYQLSDGDVEFELLLE